jgi:hypothetical protein
VVSRNEHPSRSGSTYASASFDCQPFYVFSSEALAVSNLKLLDRKLIFQPKYPFQSLADFNSHAKPENGPIEPENNSAKSTQKSRNEGGSGSLLRDLKDVRTYQVTIESIYKFFKN